MDEEEGDDDGFEKMAKVFKSSVLDWIERESMERKVRVKERSKERIASRLRGYMI